MKRKEFERVTPESVGIPSAAIDNLLDKLEVGTEPHGLMIMRHGKVCAEGYWAPYAKGLRHGLQSHSKTYTATAIGIAYTEGKLKLDDKIVDIFKDEIPDNPSENLKKLTIHDVLCMGNGMDTQPLITETWIKDFLATPVNHEPGTVFMYNNIGSTLLSAIIKRKTGMGLHEYLTPRLFNKLGIDIDNLRWIYTVDGYECGAGGLFATVEDNLRLMKLYADGGVWNGERILAEDYIEKATTKQTDQHTALEKYDPVRIDNLSGYGYQIWMCQPKDSYRADGALGQFTIVLPEKDMIVAITESAHDYKEVQKTLDSVWQMLDEIPGDKTLAEDKEASTKLANRLKSLALPSPVCAPLSDKIEKVNGVEYKVDEGRLAFEYELQYILSGIKPAPGISEFSFNFEADECTFVYTQDGAKNQLEVAMDGTRRFNRVFEEGVPTTQALASGAWVSEDTFELTVRFAETCFENKRSFTFKDNKVEIKAEDNYRFVPMQNDTIKATAK